MNRFLPLLWLGCLCLLGSAPEAPEALRPGKDYALFFAVERYDHLDNLTKPIENARAIAKELALSYGFDTLVMENPTLDQIDQTLATYRRNFRNGTFDQNGQLFIYFSGHGITAGADGDVLVRLCKPKRRVSASLTLEIS